MLKGKYFMGKRIKIWIFIAQQNRFKCLVYGLFMENDTLLTGKWDFSSDYIQKHNLAVKIPGNKAKLNTDFTQFKIN